MKSEKLDLILATGGLGMVRAAYSSSNPAIGVGPGNVPVFVHGSADVNAAAMRICESKSFDNSLLCPNESCVLVEQDIAPHLKQAFVQAGAYVCQPDEVTALRAYLCPEQGFNIKAIGRDASWIAEQAGFSVANSTCILVAPIDRVGIEEPLSNEKLCPVLGMLTGENLKQVLSMSRAMLRMKGRGHSAAIHAHDARVIMSFSAEVESLRVIVNAPCSQGAAGYATNLPPSYTLGTGFFGRSSVGDNIGPEHLVNWTRIAYNKDPAEVFDDYTGLESLTLRGQELPVVNKTQFDATLQPQGDDVAAIKSEIRRLIQEELRDILKE